MIVFWLFLLLLEGMVGLIPDVSVVVVVVVVVVIVAIATPPLASGDDDDDDDVVLNSVAIDVALTLSGLAIIVDEDDRRIGTTSPN
jgi:hypothetical protein